jgi:hypothetical protein
VYILMHSFQVLLPIFLVCVFTSNRYTSFPKSLRRVLNGLFWPEHWNRGESTNDSCSDSTGMYGTSAEPFLLLKANRIISSDILNHLLVFCTFGICSPFLAIIMVVSVSLKHLMWVVLIGRFVHYRVTGADSTSGGTDSVGNGSACDTIVKERAGGDQALVALGAACLPVLDIVSGCVWPVVWSSSLFFSFLCWDILGDEVGWKEALWAPAMMLVMCACMWVLFHIVKARPGDDFLQNEAVSSVSFSEEIQQMEANPLQNSLKMTDINE